MAENGQIPPSFTPHIVTMPPMTWTQLPVQVEGRIPRLKNHTATLVGTKLYIFGGYDGRVNHNTMNILDCSTFEWSVLRGASLHVDPVTNIREKPRGRNGHTSTLVDGQLFILGGWDGSGVFASSELWIFDTNLNRWSKPITFGDGPGPCNLHTCDYLPERNSLVVFRGGDGREYLNDLHYLDVRTLAWRPINPVGRLPVRRANHSSCVVGSNVYIFGGWDGQKRLNDIHVLNTRLDPPEWSTPENIGNAPAPRAGMRMVSVNSRIFVFGGSGTQNECFDDVQVFNTGQTNIPAAGSNVQKWLRVSRVNEDSQFAGAGGTVDGAEEMRIRKQALERREQLEQSLENNNIIVVSNEVGAFREGNPNAEPPLSEVTILRSPPEQRAGHSATLFGRKIIVFGGARSYPQSQGSKTVYFNDVFALDTDPPPEILLPNAHTLTSFQTNLARFMDNNKLCDVVFKVENRLVYGHRIVLSLMSDRFRAMFLLKFKEEHQHEIVVKGVSYEAFMKMMEFIYTGRCPDLNIFYPENTETSIAPENKKKGLLADDEDLEFGPTEEDDNDSDILNEDFLRDEAESEHALQVENMRNRNFSIATVSTQRRKQMRVEGLKELILSQTRDSKDFHRRVDLNKAALVLELLAVSDEYMLDILRQGCEKALQPLISIETVDMLLEEAKRCNADQLFQSCMHFKRNYAANPEDGS